MLRCLSLAVALHHNAVLSPPGHVTMYPDVADRKSTLRTEDEE
jgi:hypothetical protein